MRYMLILLGLLWIGTANAMDCQTPPDCESLGYSKEEDPNCADGGYMTCPFDEEYKKCVQPNCETLGFTESDKTSWCKNIATCPGNEKYTLCVKAFCEIGDVFYADGSCGLAEDYNPNNKDKTPIGVVYYVTDGGHHGKIVSLENVKRYGDSVFNSDQNRVGFGLTSYAIPELDAMAGKTQLLQERSPKFYDGEEITNILIKIVKPDCAYESGTGSYRLYCVARAALMAHEFYPSGVAPSDTSFGQGKWYLPAIGELMDMYGTDNAKITNVMEMSGAKGDVIQKVNKTLEILADAKVAQTIYTDLYYWSSTKSESASNIFHLEFKNGRRGHANTSNGWYPIRASLKF